MPSIDRRGRDLERLARLTGHTPAGANDELDPTLAQVALGEGLGPLLGARVSAGQLTCQDETLRRELVRQHHLCVARELMIERVLQRVRGPLTEREIPAMLLKGAALLRQVYRSGERPMSDVDVLVPPSRWEAARAALAEVKIVLSDPYDRPLTALHDYAVPLMSPERMAVELHRYLSSRPLFRVDYQGDGNLFSRAQVMPDGFLVPAPTDLFVSLALHAGKHGLTLPFRSVIDGLAVASRLPLSPIEVVERARSWRACRSTAAWILMLRRFGLPGEGWDAAAASLAPPAVLQDLVDGAPYAETEVAGLDQVRRIARCLDSSSRRLGYVVQRLGLRAADAVVGRWTRSS